MENSPEGLKAQLELIFKGKEGVSFLAQEFDYGNELGVAIVLSDEGNRHRRLRHAIKFAKEVVDDPGEFEWRLEPVSEEQRQVWAKLELRGELEDEPWERPLTLILSGQEYWPVQHWIRPRTYKPNPITAKDIAQALRDWCQDLADRGRLAEKAL